MVVLIHQSNTKDIRPLIWAVDEAFERRACFPVFVRCGSMLAKSSAAA
jgi:hypothetical protein